MMYVVTGLAILLTMGMALARVMAGPTLYDRILATNVFGTKTVLIIAVIGFLVGRPEFIDVAIVYALINFIGIVAVLKFFEYGSFGSGSQDPGRQGQAARGAAMMGLLLDLLSWALLLIGSAFLLVGGIGLLRFPDFYARLQAAGITDTVSSITILLGLTLQADALPTAVKLLFTLAFLLFTAPLASLSLAKAARHSRVDPWRPEDGGGSSPP
jgi:monovalent cation/proton antiporter MnhG/PhaG subunit